MDFADKMRAHRKAKKISRKKLAQMTGIHHGTLVNYEYRRNDPALSKAKKIADLLGFDL